MLDGSFEPPVRPHEGEGDRDLGVHGPEGPVLPEEEDRRLSERDSNWHEDDDFKKDPEEERNHADQKDDGDAGFCSLKTIFLSNDATNINNINKYK